jgi:hypothetical protein
MERIKIHDGCEIVYLHFLSDAYVNDGLIKIASESLDSFILILYMEGVLIRAPNIDILIPQGSRSRRADLKYSLTIPAGFEHRTDRISRVMRSRRLVSAALRRRPDSKFLVYVLDITIDPQGKLPRPDLDE